MRLKDLSMKLRAGNIQELENVPAYKRKEIALQQTPPSDESQVSKFSLLQDEEGNIEIKNNNSLMIRSSCFPNRLPTAPGQGDMTRGNSTKLACPGAW